MRTAALLRTGRVSLHTHPIRGVVGAQCFSHARRSLLILLFILKIMLNTFTGVDAIWSTVPTCTPCRRRRRGYGGSCRRNRRLYTRGGGELLVDLPSIHLKANSAALMRRLRLKLRKYLQEVHVRPQPGIGHVSCRMHPLWLVCESMTFAKHCSQKT